MQIVQKANIPYGVKNYQTERGWQQAVITAQEADAIQQWYRDEANKVMTESLQDAGEQLGKLAMRSCVTPTNVRELATFMAERRLPHISRVFEDFLKVKVEKERHDIASEVSA